MSPFAVASDIRAGLERYEAERKPVVEKIVAAATTSAKWYSTFADHMQLAPVDFAYSYMTRSGRISDERLRALAPRFMAQYDAHRVAASSDAEARHARAS